MNIERLKNKKGYKVEVDGDEHIFPSVTTAISESVHKPGLAPGMMKKALLAMERIFTSDEFDPKTFVESVRKAAYAREAADWGEAAHAAVHEALVNGTKPDPEYQRIVDGVLGWLAEHDFEVINAELPVASVFHRYAGTIDLIAKCGGQVAIIDLKTGVGIYPEAALQTAAYAAAYEEMTGDLVTSCWVLRVPRVQPGPDDPPFEAKQVNDWISVRDVFVNALGVYEGMKSPLFVE
jgi:hypothetical protein